MGGYLSYQALEAENESLRFRIKEKDRKFADVITTQSELQARLSKAERLLMNTLQIGVTMSDTYVKQQIMEYFNTKEK